MMRISSSRSKVLAGGLIAAFFLLTTPLPNSAQTQPKSYARQGTLQGTVYSEGQKARVASATVKIRNLNTTRGNIRASRPTPRAATRS